MRKVKEHVMLEAVRHHLKWIVLMIIGVCIGVMYALLKRTYEPVFFLLYTFIKEDNLKVGQIEIFKHTVFTYGTQVLVLWGCGFFKLTKLIMYMVYIGFVVCYGFSVSMLLMMYGLKGIGIIMLLFGIQMVTMISLFIIIGISSEKKVQTSNNYNHKKYMYVLMFCIVVVVCTGVQNTYVQPLFEKIIQSLL